MVTEKACPYCKRVHFSTYNAERCEALHQVQGTASYHKYKDKKKREKQMASQASQNVEQPEPVN
jgi:hypothetical protein